MISACKRMTRCEYPRSTLLQPGQHLLAATVSSRIPAHTAPAPAFLPQPTLPPATVTITSGSYRAPASLTPETLTAGTCETSPLLLQLGRTRIPLPRAVSQPGLQMLVCTVPVTNPAVFCPPRCSLHRPWCKTRKFVCTEQPEGNTGQHSLGQFPPRSGCPGPRAPGQLFPQGSLR